MALPSGIAPTRRFLELDALRGVAAVWVVLYHCIASLPYWLPNAPETIAAVLPTRFDLHGTSAVDLFFMISGYVILVTTQRSATARAFLQARVARLFPAYWAAVLVTAALGLAVPSDAMRVGVMQVLANLTMLQSFLAVPHLDPSYWSLAVELSFYALVAVALAVGQQGRLDRLALAWVILAALALHALPQLGLALPYRVKLALALENAPLFTAGMLFYRLRTEPVRAWRVAGLVACYAASALPQSSVIAPITTALFVLFALAVAGWVRWLANPVLLWLGGISYSLYLVHQPLAFRLQVGLHAAGVDGWPNFAGTVACLLAAGAAMQVLVEKPGTRWLRRVFEDVQRSAPNVPVGRT